MARHEADAPAHGRLVGLKVLVLVSGAVLMALEIAGSRVLAPHFGNSVFVWGSLISVFLTALSLGYWAGGVLADRRPSLAVLETNCLLVAGLLFLIPWYAHPFAEALVGLGLAEQSGPIVAATVLFLPPSFLLGMVSPFSVRLAARDVQSVGRAAGSLYALSTVGSIVGTLVTTFVLIPLLGVSDILRGLALAMVLVFVGLLVAARRARGVVPAVVVAIVGWLVPSSPVAKLGRDEKLVLSASTPYHQIQVVDVSGRARLLKFDRYVESAIDLREPHRTFSAYTDYFQLAFLLRPDMKRVLFIGAGGGIGPRSFLEEKPELHVDVVDVDRRVLQIAHEQFFMPEGGNLRAIAEDGRMFLRGAEPGYDVIVLDAFTIGGRIPFHLATREAFALARARLAPGGVFFMNINSSVGGESGGIFASVGRTLEAAFPSVQAFVHEWRVDPRTSRDRNIIFVAAADPLPSPEEWMLRAVRFRPHSSLPPESVRDMARDLMPQLPDFSKATLLTDEHAPIETMRF
jgi:spermidine synthase